MTRTARERSARPLPRSPHGRRLLLAAGAIVLAHLLLAATSVSRLSLTFDEHLYIPAGHLYWTERDFGVNRVHPPLAKLVAGAPLAAMDLESGESAAILDDAPRDAISWEYFRFGEAFLMDDNPERFEAIVRASRLAMLVFPLLLLLVVWAWSRELFGPAGGIVSLLLAASNPDVLAYGPLATTDMATAALYVTTVFLLWSHARRPARWKLVAFGPVLALALLAKYSGLLLVPVMGVLAIVAVLRGADPVEWLDPGGDDPRRARRLSKGAAIVVGTLVATMWAGYLFAESPLAYLKGLDVLSGYSEKSYEAFLLGRYSLEGFWHYYPVALAVKIPLATWALAGLGAWFLARGRRPATAFTWACLTVPPVVLIVAMTVTTVHIGHRYVLGVHPFLFVAAGAAGPWAVRALRAERARGLVVVALFAWAAAAGVRSRPFHIAYHNALVPSDLAFFDVLDATNVEWYHGWREVARLQREGGLDDVVAIQLPDHLRGWLRPYGIRWAPARVDDDPPAPGTYLFPALERRFLERFRRRQGQPTPLLDDYPVTDVIAGAVFVARVSDPLDPVTGPRSTDRARYPDGSLASEYEVVRLEDGRTVAHGTYRTWHPDGTPREEGAMRLGRPHGPYRLYHPNGVLAEEGATWLGELHGTIRRWDENGEPIDAQAYWQGARIRGPGTGSGGARVPSAVGRGAPAKRLGPRAG